MARHVFISYSKKDSDFAHRLADDLIANGHDIWIDRTLKVGDKWEKIIEENLLEANEIIVVLSSNSIASKWVQHEGSMAYALGKNFFPLLIEKIPKVLKGL